jgi:cytochrome c oxidase subunit III
MDYMYPKIYDGNLSPQKKPQINLSPNPIKLALWLFIAIIAIIYMSLSAIYVSGKNYSLYQNRNLQEIFFYNSLPIILSILTVYWAYIAAKRNNLNELKFALLLTICLGLYFINQQKTGLAEILKRESIPQMTSTSAFFLIITSLHAIQIVVGLIFLLVTLLKIFDYRVHSKNMLQMELSFSFWGFSVIVWICFLIIFGEIL